MNVIGDAQARPILVSTLVTFKFIITVFMAYFHVRRETDILLTPYMCIADYVHVTSTGIIS